MYTREQFVAKYGGFINNAVKGTGLLAGTVIAQAIIESQGSSNGQMLVGGSKLARNSNNYFGIKCHNWTGKTYNIDTNEVDKSGNVYVDSKACFRAYDSVEDSIKDYIKFLQTNPRYKTAGVFSADTVKTQADALQRGGYATNPNYANLISQVYEGVSSYIDKYKQYGVSGITKSFINNPVSFIKRNWIPISILGVTIAVTIGGVIYLKNKN
jgi:peptidoglycan hydrolase FlgJ